MLNAVAPAIRGIIQLTSVHSHIFRNLHTYELTYAYTYILTGKNYVPKYGFLTDNVIDATLVRQKCQEITCLVGI